MRVGSTTRTAAAPVTEDEMLMCASTGSTGAMKSFIVGTWSVGESAATMYCSDTRVKDHVWPHASWGPLGHRPASHSSVGSLRITSALMMFRSVCDTHKQTVAGAGQAASITPGDTVPCGARVWCTGVEAYL